MDKFKTSDMGRALKRVFRGESGVKDTVAMAVGEISEYFKPIPELPLEEDTDTGFFGDIVGKCPICSSDVKRNKFGYGCSAYKEGCKFRVSAYMCGRAISKKNVSLMLESGRTSIIKGFVSPRTSKSFDAALKIDGDKCVFDF
jgi:hypothetical protein